MIYVLISVEFLGELFSFVVYYSHVKGPTNNENEVGLYWITDGNTGAWISFRNSKKSSKPSLRWVTEALQGVDLVDNLHEVLVSRYNFTDFFVFHQVFLHVLENGIPHHDLLRSLPNEFRLLDEFDLGRLLLMMNLGFLS